MTLSKNLLTIKGEKRSETEKKEQSHVMAEPCYGTFSRSLRLPHPVDDEKVPAKQYRPAVFTAGRPSRFPSAPLALMIGSWEPPASLSILPVRPVAYWRMRPSGLTVR